MLMLKLYRTNRSELPDMDWMGKLPVWLTNTWLMADIYNVYISLVLLVFLVPVDDGSVGGGGSGGLGRL